MTGVDGDRGERGVCGIGVGGDRGERGVCGIGVVDRLLDSELSCRRHCRFLERLSFSSNSLSCLSCSLFLLLHSTISWVISSHAL